MNLISLGQDADNLDFEALLRKILAKHAEAILRMFQAQLQHGPSLSFAQPDQVTLQSNGLLSAFHAVQARDTVVVVDGFFALRVKLCADEVVIVTIDPRTGRLTLLDTGDLAAAGRGPRFSVITEKLNENPSIMFEALIRFRIQVSCDHFVTEMTITGAS